MKLYKLVTGFTNGEYYVLANDPTEAESKLNKYVDGYGFTDDRKVKSIHIIAESKSENTNYIGGKNLVL